MVVFSKLSGMVRWVPQFVELRFFSLMLVVGSIIPMVLSSLTDYQPEPVPDFPITEFFSI
jgi:hypothetical protein